MFLCRAVSCHAIASSKLARPCRWPRRPSQMNPTVRSGIGQDNGGKQGEVDGDHIAILLEYLDAGKLMSQDDLPT